MQKSRTAQPTAAHLRTPARLVSRSLRRTTLAVLVTSLVIVASFVSVLAPPSPVSAASGTTGNKVAVTAFVRVATVGRNYELEVQLIDLPAGTGLVEGLNYHLRYPDTRSKLRKKNPAMFNALNALRTNDVAEVTFAVETSTSSRKCVTSATGTLCSGGSTSTDLDLLEVSAPKGTCLRGLAQTISHDTRHWKPRPVLCLRNTGSSTLVAGLVTEFTADAINDVTVTLVSGTRQLVGTNSVPGDISWVDLGQLVPNGRYRLAGCIDVRDDGDDCKPGKVVTVRYRAR
jgi:hypothetical protein